MPVNVDWVNSASTAEVGTWGNGSPQWPVPRSRQMRTVFVAAAELVVNWFSQETALTPASAQAMTVS